jgi:tetratricopeptide (TPR) repeat protein
MRNRHKSTKVGTDGPHGTGSRCCAAGRRGLLLLLTLLGAVTATAQAQSVTVLTSGEDARHCSLAAKLNGALVPSPGELAYCDRAIDGLSLNRRDRAGTLVNRGILLTAAGRFQQALDDYNEALQLLPELPQAFNGKGNLYFLAERYDEALAAYRRALELDLQERHIAFYNLGLTYDQLQDAGAARRSYEQAMEAAPDWPLPREKLAARGESVAVPR